MAKLRNISNDVLVVPALGGVTVEPDQVVDVPDDLAEEMDWPETTWAVVAPAKKTIKDKE